jgi:hypothetical protein
MYLHHTKEVPFDDWADAIWAAATRCGAPMVPPITAQHLAMAYLSGPQLEMYGSQLDLEARKDSSFRHKRGTGILRRELVQCSMLIVVTTNVDLRLVSNRSTDPYRVIERFYQGVADRYEDLNVLVIRGLADMPPSQERLSA